MIFLQIHNYNVAHIAQVRDCRIIIAKRERKLKNSLQESMYVDLQDQPQVSNYQTRNEFWYAYILRLILHMVYNTLDSTKQLRIINMVYVKSS